MEICRREILTGLATAAAAIGLAPVLPASAAPLAFSRTGDPATGEFRDAKVIKTFGEVPNDLSSL